MTTYSQAHWQGSVFCIVDPQGTLMLGSNFLRHRQGFEMGIKDCVLTKKDQVFLFFFYQSYSQDVFFFQE